MLLFLFCFFCFFCDIIYLYLILEIILVLTANSNGCMFVIYTIILKFVIFNHPAFVIILISIITEYQVQGYTVTTICVIWVRCNFPSVFSDLGKRNGMCNTTTNYSQGPFKNMPHFILSRQCLEKQM